MTNREGRPPVWYSDSLKNHGPQSQSVPPTFDLAKFVDRYHNLLELLYPLSLAGNACLYIFRWQSCLLTLVVLVILSILLYNPKLLLCFSIFMSIILMAVGKYYSQTKALSRLKMRIPPKTELLDQDAQHFKNLQKEQKKSRKTLLEFRLIIHKIDKFIVKVSNFLEYFYNIILWKSTEVSLCVTVLLCIGFVLVCTVYLRAISACIPLVVLCFNGYFFRRIVDFLKSLGRFIFNLFRWRQRKRASTGNPAAAKPASTETEGAESDEGRTSRSSNDSQNAAASGSGEAPPAESTTPTSDPEDTTRLRTESIRPVGASASGGASLTASGTSTGGAVSSPPAKVVEFCSRCNVSFAKLLKRKHDCSSCGQSFCGSCTVKVKRALLGATSPAAFEESVRVCMDCKAVLDNYAENARISNSMASTSAPT